MRITSGQGVNSRGFGDRAIDSHMHIVALYRHVGDTFKVGAGYNFGCFADDLRDLTLNDEGVFLNVIGKF